MPGQMFKKTQDIRDMMFLSGQLELPLRLDSRVRGADHCRAGVAESAWAVALLWKL